MKWFIASRLIFSDGSDSCMVIQRGLQDEAACKRIADLLPAVSYSGEKEVKYAELVWAPEPKGQP